MGSRQNAIIRTDRYFQSGEFVEDLARLVAHPTESQKPDQLHHLHAYIDEAIAPILAAMDFDLEKLPNSQPDKGPFLIASRIESTDLPTILIYGHGDVVRGQKDQWREGLSPFETKIEGDRIYGRGTADNKGQHLINLMALNSVLQERGFLGYNVKFLLEMGEETGSPGLHSLCAEQSDALSADALIASDGPRLQPGTPTIFTGSRGGINFDLVVHLRIGAHHSGNFGGLLADPAIILAHALASITDKQGQLLIDAWRPTSLTPQVSALLADLPIGGDEPAIDEYWGEAGLLPAERAFGWNSFAVLAMKSGVPEAPVNAISGHARATCQLRFVVGTDPQEILPALRTHLDAHGFDMVKIDSESGALFHATRLSTEHPLLKFVASSLATTSGQRPHILPNLAGSLPNDCFAEILGLPTIWVPHSYAACSQHAPNEHLLMSTSQDALRCMTGVFWDLADAGPKTYQT
ncbi:MAG: M20/M25/M40 family metallo-hydrolase [Rhizobiaceae bacterium]|nr:M20/M25/M40 family metallo-hydrolase [Rhizobiaceae bacterium]